MADLTILKASALPYLEGLIQDEAQARSAIASGLQDEMRSGRVCTIAGGDHPSGASIPSEFDANLVIMRNNAAGTVTFWRTVGPPADGLETETLKMDANGGWWFKVLDLDMTLLRNEVRNGRVFATSGGNTPSGVTGIPPSYSIDVLIMRNFAARTFSLWLPGNAPADGIETETLAKDSNGSWWEKMTSFDSNAVKTDLDRGRTYVQYTIMVSDRTIPDTAKGVLSTNGTELAFWTPATAPSDGIETETLQQDANDKWWSRVWLSTAAAFDPATAFRNPDVTSTTLFQLLKTYAGPAVLGFRADGSWAEPTPFGGLRWPGDDLVVFETQAGDPLLAFAPDGTLIAKGI